MISLKSQKGSISLYALVSLLVLSIILLSIYLYNANMQMAGLEITNKIKSTYEKDINNINEVYEKIDNI